MSLHFPDMAQQAFSFLEGAGFRLTQSGPAQLQYETAHVFVAVEWDSRSGELNAFVGLQPQKGQTGAFSPTDLLAMEGVDVPGEESRFRLPRKANSGRFLIN